MHQSVEENTHSLKTSTLHKDIMQSKTAEFEEKRVTVSGGENSNFAPIGSGIISTCLI